MRLRLFMPLLFLAATAVAQEPPAKLRVGLFDRPPMVIKGENGHWTGLAVDLWEKISGNLHLDFEYVEVPEEEVIGKLSRSELDLALGEIGVSAERERLVDFTQPFIVTAGAVALRRDATLGSWEQIVQGLTHRGLLLVLVLMIGTLFVFSFLLWLIERGLHQSHFGGHPIRGFGSALWFAAVTMTTVGYGDKTPQSLLGRFLAFVWMFLGILLVSAFTGSVASSITVAQLNSSISHVNDLARFRNGVLEGSQAEDFLALAGIPARKFESAEAGFRALADGQINAFVGNELTLQYLVRRDYPEALKVLRFAGTHVSYAMATRPHFPLLDAINVEIIGITNAPDWQLTVDRWLGPSSSR